MRRRRRSWAFWYVLTVLVLTGYSGWALLRPLPALQPVQTAQQLRLETSPSALNWPPGTQAAVGILGSDILETSGPETPVAIASTAKIITALMVLQAKPLALNQPGPTITLTADDVARYRAYVAQDGSVVPVQAGEQLSLYQALQTVMLPSANNMADSLVIWAYGSLPAYAEAANAYLAAQGLTDTHVGTDASGLAPDTTSTASDLVKIGKLAMQNPVLAQIVGQSTATGIPLAGTIRNVNHLLGTSGIIGIKTGNSDQAGGAFVGAAQVVVNGKTETVLTAVLGAPNRPAAMQQSLALIQSAQANFEPVSIIKQGETAGSYQVPWGGTVSAIAYQDLSVSAWRGSTLTAKSSLQQIEPDAKAGQTVGKLSAQSLTIPLKLKSTPPQPSTWWRLSHPLY